MVRNEFIQLKCGGGHSWRRVRRWSCWQVAQDPAAAPGKVPAQATAPAATNAAGPQSQQPGMTTAQSVDNAAKAYKVQQLINTAEKSYHSGVDNYRAGHLDARASTLTPPSTSCSPAAWTSRAIPSSPTSSNICSAP